MTDTKKKDKNLKPPLPNKQNDQDSIPKSDQIPKKSNKYLTTLSAGSERKRKLNVRFDENDFTLTTGRGLPVAAGSTRKRVRSAKKDDAPAKPKRPTNFTEPPVANGSYKTYYRRRVASGDDSRLALLRREWASKGGRILDIGCNDGAFTMQVGRRFAPASVVGVDIDAVLVRRAQQRMRDTASHLEKQATVAKDDDSAAADAVQKESSDTNTKKLPAEIVPEGYPQNVTFRVEDVSDDTDVEVSALTGAPYDVVLAMSVTKWVHMHSGDEGIKRLFARVRRSLRPGGTFVLEPQLSKSYKNARRSGAVAAHLTLDKFALKPERFSDYLLAEGGFARVEMLREKQPRNTPFGNRPVMAFFTAEGTAPSATIGTAASSKKVSAAIKSNNKDLMAIDSENGVSAYSKKKDIDAKGDKKGALPKGGKKSTSAKGDEKATTTKGNKKGDRTRVEKKAASTKHSKEGASKEKETATKRESDEKSLVGKGDEKAPSMKDIKKGATAKRTKKDTTTKNIKKDAAAKGIKKGAITKDTKKASKAKGTKKGATIEIDDDAA